MSDFVPPCCPNQSCRMHTAPVPRFFERRGSYRPKCRSAPVPRFRCRTCRRGFSFQTFRVDYRDHRPHDNVTLFSLLVSGVGLRQAGRLIRMNVGSLQRKFRKLGRALRRLNRNLRCKLPAHRTLVFDELETFEHSAICPVTVPVVVDRDSKLVVAASAAPIRRVAAKGSRRQRWLARHEEKHGRRRDRSRVCVHLVLRRCRDLLGDTPVVLLSDQKPLYASLCRRLFGARSRHQTFSGKLARTVFNPLFPVNHAEAMLRDNCGRLRRRSWLVSKNVRYLRLHLEYFVAYRNWHRACTNHHPLGHAPGVLLHLIPRNLDLAELVAWRQDWGTRSIHPTTQASAA